jgi:predicted MFS family arabinose efflux permease
MKTAFTSYQKFVIAVIAFLQFTIILDFMILSPLGAILMPKLGITPSQFGLVVSAYAFSAGGSGLLAAGFADRFDRKKLLLFFYVGFVVGTLLCGLAPDYHFLLMARIVTGIFGGVVSSITGAIITDLFSYELRGRVMGIVQTAFAASQILGIPLGLYLSNLWGWHAPFILIVGFSSVAGVLIWWKLAPIDAHLKLHPDRKAVHHLIHTLSQPRYLQGFAATALLTTGGFMIMPFGSAFNVYNLGITIEQLPLIYLVTGAFTMVAGPFIGKLSDRLGKIQVFIVGSAITIVTTLYFTRMGLSPLWLVIAINVAMFTGGATRMISSSALMTALPTPSDRGAYMAISSSIQQISGGMAAALAGWIIVSKPDGSLLHFDKVGNVIVFTTFLTMMMMVMINQFIRKSPIEK